MEQGGWGREWANSKCVLTISKNGVFWVDLVNMPNRGLFLYIGRIPDTPTHATAGAWRDGVGAAGNNPPTPLHWEHLNGGDEASRESLLGCWLAAYQPYDKRWSKCSTRAGPPLSLWPTRSSLSPSSLGQASVMDPVRAAALLCFPATSTVSRLP